jgi:translocation and assembly module TamB
MSRRSRLALIISGAVFGLIFVLAVTAVVVLRSAWFREQVRQRIVAEAEKATGGRAEIGSFDFDWSTMTARLKGFVMHGTEPAGSPPLLRVRSITVVLKIVSMLRRTVDVQSIDVDQPQAHVIVSPDGNTNVPEPRTPRATNKTPVETILDLAVGRFTVESGAIEVNSQRMPWSAAGENLRAQVVYERLTPSYRGEISMQPLHLQISNNLPVDLGAAVSLTIEKNKATISRARLETARSNAEISGAVENFSSPQCTFQYNVRLSLDELLRTLRFRSRPQGTVLIGGNASFRDFAHYLLTGNMHVGPLSFGQGGVQVRDVRGESAFRMDPEKIDFSGIRLSAPEGNFNGRARIQKLDRFRMEGELSHFDLRRLAKLYTSQRLPWDGILSGSLEMNGLVSDLYRGRFDARGQLIISPAPGSAPVEGKIDASYHGDHETLDLGNSFLQLPATRLDFTGTLGQQLQVHLRSTNLDDLLPALELASDSPPQSMPLKLQNGVAVFDGTITGRWNALQVAGHVAATQVLYSQEKIDTLAADISVQESELRIQNATLARGSLRSQLSATVVLRDWKPDDAGALTATASVRGADIQDLLALAGKQAVPATGTLSASAQVTGTIGTPLIKADVNAGNGSVYHEPFDHFTAHVDYRDRLVTVANAQLKAGARELKGNATYTHAPGDFENGRLTFQVTSNQLPLNEFQLVRQNRTPLAGSVQLAAKGSATVTKSPAGAVTLQLADLSAEVNGHDIQVDQKPVGTVHLTAGTQGSMLAAHLEAEIAKSTIRADGQWQFTAGYPGSAQLTFTKIDLATIESWVARPASAIGVAGSLDGKVTISGPALQPEAWTAALEIPHLEISPIQRGVTTGAPEIILRNEGTVRLTLKNGVVRVESARLTGLATNVTLVGNVSLKEAKNPLDLRLNGTIDLTILESLERDLSASGTLVTDANIRGPLTQPLIAGRMQLQNANLNLATFPNGLSNANGVILFGGNRATIQSMTGESGGGKVSVTGFVSYVGGEPAFRFEVAANQMRVRYPEGVSTVADSKLTWTGTLQRSLASGTITILRTGFNARTDLGSVLAKSAEPVRSPAATRTGLLGGLNFDIQIETSPDVLVQSALAQQIQAEASLRLRGSPSNPVLLGRISISQGELTFFGNKYTINQGSVSFFNPVKIEPILNIDLQTRARGVDVTLTISGPMSKLNVSYRSDPPLQFSEIVALLATGRAPSSDPSLAARQSATTQNWQQMGASALVGQAIANPVAGRLQRFFGVSAIKIDPLLTGVDNNPQARLTIEQQVTPNITFTYITNLTRTNPQVVRVEWSLNKRWSVVALREENGLFGMDFYYKKGFK